MTALRITLDGYLSVEEVRVYLQVLQTLGFGQSVLLENTATPSLERDTTLTAEMDVLDVDTSALAGLEDL